MSWHKIVRSTFYGFFIFSFLLGTVSIAPGQAAGPHKPEAEIPQAVDQIIPESNGWIGFGGEQVPSAPALTLSRAGSTAIDLSAHIPGVYARTEQVEGNGYTHFYGDGFGAGAEIGLPDLPVLRRTVEIPFGASANLEVVNTQVSETSLKALNLPGSILPLQPSVSKCAGLSGSQKFTQNQKVYATDSFFPEQVVSIRDEFIERGHRGLLVEVWPVAYNPVSGRLRFYSQVDFKINLSGSDMSLTRSYAERYASAAFDGYLSHQWLNYNQGQLLPITSPNITPDGYLIISADAYYDSIAPFAALKQSQGFEVTHTRLSEIPGGGSTADIKSYIQTAYNTWPIPPSYVLLVGDTNTIPTWTGSEIGTSTDLYYATMEGPNDWHPDIGRGRFPVRSAAQATIMVNKYLAYAGLTGLEPWLKKAAFPATCDNYVVAEGTHDYVIDNHTLPAGYTGIFPENPQPGGDKLYCHTYGAGTEDLNNAVNDGRELVIYSGHGSYTGWEFYSQGDVVNLENDGTFPFVASHACLTGDFGQSEVYGETWVLQENKGALAFWGSSTYSYWDEDDVLERGMFDALFATPQPSFTGMTYAGLEVVESNYQVNARYYWETYNILGDPAAEIILGPQGPAINLSANPQSIDLCSTNSVTTTIAAESILYAGEPFTLTAQNIPASINYTFEPANFILPGESILSLTDNGVTAQGSYPFQINGKAPVVSRTITATLNVFAAAPTLPVLTNPPNQADNQPLRPTFTWNVEHASSYDIQIASDRGFTQIVVSADDLLDNQFTPGIDFKQNTVYYWRVQAHNACGNSGYSPASSFITIPPLGSCSLGRVSNTLMSEDFEDGAPEWSHDGLGDTWAADIVRKHGGNYSFKAIDSNTVTDQRLRSPEIDLASGQNPLILQYWNYQNLENVEGGCKDGGILEISTDHGITWAQLESELLTDPYDGLVSYGTENPLAGQNAWCGRPQTWTNTLVTLDNYAGDSITFRYRLGTNNSVGLEGWYLDDLAVKSCIPGASLSPDSVQEASPGSSVTHSFILNNLGITDTYQLSVSSNFWPTQLGGSNLVTVTEGSAATVTVQVNIPSGSPSGSDSFTLTATSVNIPGITFAVNGTTDIVIHPQVELLPVTSVITGTPGSQAIHILTIKNLGDFTDTFTLEATSFWNGSLSSKSTGPLRPGESTQVILTVDIPLNAFPGDSDIATVTATSTLDAHIQATTRARTIARYPYGIYLPVIGK